MAVDHGEGATLYDPEGNAYVDFASGIGVSCLGYGCQPWAEAIAKQAGKVGHTSNLFYTEPLPGWRRSSARRTGMSCAFFANGGGEANEGMIKLARKYSFDKYGQGRATIVTLNNSFHGRTITTLTATGQEVFHNYFFPFTEGFGTPTPTTLASLEAAAGDDVCAVMVELVQGEGGVLPLDQDYVKAVAKLCAEKRLAAAGGRGPDRRGPDRQPLRLPAVRHFAGRGVLCQGHCRRPAHERHPGQ